MLSRRRVDTAAEVRISSERREGKSWSSSHPSHKGSQPTTCCSYQIATRYNLTRKSAACTEMAQQTMKAVVFDGPHKVSIQDRPVPKRESDPRGRR